MSNGSDPTAVLTALDRAQDAFEMIGRGRTAFEDGISADEDWKTQLTKACRLLAVVDTLQSQDGYHTAVIEVCFGAIERSIEAYALAMTNDTLQDFQDHQFSYERAHQIGLFERETAEAMKDLYSEHRTESYYGGGVPQESKRQPLLRSPAHSHSSQ